MTSIADWLEFATKNGDSLEFTPDGEIHILKTARPEVLTQPKHIVKVQAPIRPGNVYERSGYWQYSINYGEARRR